MNNTIIVLLQLTKVDEPLNKETKKPKPQSNISI